MNSFLNRKFPGLAKRLLFFQPEESTCYHKEIDAPEFWKICALIFPPKKNTNPEIAPDIFLRPHKDTSPFSLYLEPLLICPDKLNVAHDYIKASGLEKNIIFRANHVTFKNLKINGFVQIVFSTLNAIQIEFENNIFSTDVEITIMSAADTTIIFDGNKFSQLFILDIRFAFNIADNFFVCIENNNISDRMGIYYNVIPLLPNNPGYRKTEKPPNNNQSFDFFMIFSETKVDHLDIRDRSDSSDLHKRDHDYPMEKIVFDGGNHIRILEIHTKHTILTPAEQLKVNVNKTSFSASDKLGISHSKTDGTPNERQLNYGQFFSLLKAQASEQCDQINEELYKRKARYFKRKFSPRWEDRFIFTWTDLVSKDGTSWLRPILWLTATETLLAVAAYYFHLGWDLNYFLGEGRKIFLTLFAWFMNPASLLPLPSLLFTKEIIAKPWLIYPLFFCQKFFAVVFYYEIVKTLRRFTR